MVRQVILYVDIIILSKYYHIEQNNVFRSFEFSSYHKFNIALYGYFIIRRLLLLITYIY